MIEIALTVIRELPLRAREYIRRVGAEIGGAALSAGPTTSIVVPPALRHAGDGRPLGAFTVDVEDWYQSCIDPDAPITERVVRNVDRVLGVLDDCGVKGTFFVQGLVAERFPHLVQTLASEGHEVQSHGYSHRPLSAMNRSALRDEVRRAKQTVEDAGGARVTAFRAQDFSILRGNLWALETLVEAGFEVDSSIFPMRSRNYGIGGWHVGPHYVTVGSGATLLEVPVAVWARRSVRVPVAGGGYFRLLPLPVLRNALTAIVRSRPAIVYCHPYEFNATELAEYRGKASRRYLIAQGFGRTSFVNRVRRLLQDLSFGRFDDVLAAWNLACGSPS
jgi:polysaccharide deacetylase family protein (PEP-CTERM system associated)